ncbi:two-component system sensor histidine kinase NtrB [Spirochaeta africana]|uniref:histidine kinase n=1 Tax=Spirochaeta africana (strain ATCC 700263 / DSM 8902 / Z-7692) TaxID=889378 RepID=H9UGP9_SPIAZ|nr:ATP-binding protein [Spirochaeta africana]AFG36692.1 PAS domain S-box [Spirochaeta africana DSM 8902]
MRRFVQRALKILPKLTAEQIHDLICTLSQENEKLEVVLDSMNEGVIVADRENRILLVNKPAERLLTMPLPEQLQEHHVCEIIRDPVLAGFVRDVLVNQETVQDREFSVDESGSVRTLSCSIVPLVQDGRIEGTILSAEDITDRKLREARLRRFESLASLTTLAAGVAHEIKNPLGSIGIHMQLIEKSLKQQSVEDSDGLLQYVTVVNEEVERLNKIVVDFLFAVRPMDIQPIDSDLGQIVHELLQFVQYELEQNYIELIEEISEDLPLLQLDERYIKQAVLNIVKNAIAAMPGGGELRVRIRTQGDDVVLCISDTGVGMDEATQNRIFEPYFTTRDFGSGLGLTLAYKIVKEHMAEIAVHSSPGDGSSFSIQFPVPQRSPKLLAYKGEPEE